MDSQGRHRGHLALLIAVALVFAMAGAAFAAVGTDQADYVPGSTVTISGDNSDGAGYLPGEAVTVAVTGPNGYTASCEATVGDDGAWSCSIVLWGDESAIGDYSYTVTSTSGVTQSGAFTDAPVPYTVTVDINVAHIGATNPGFTVGGDCESVYEILEPTAPNDWGWHFVAPQGEFDSLTVTFVNAGTIGPISPVVGVNSWPDAKHLYVFTAEGDTLVSASATISGESPPPAPNDFNLSHVCGGTEAPDVRVSGMKYYDANTNGSFDAGEVGIANWPIDYTDGTSDTVYTGLDGTFSLLLDPDDYVFSEQQAGSPWIQTGNLIDQSSNGSLQGDMTYEFTLGGDAVTGLNFGNICIGGGGGRTLGFWSNRNGRALFGAPDLALMVSLNLRNANGSHFDPANYSGFRTWLLNATATNMAYMLSAQLAAMELNVFNGLVDGTALIYAPGTTSANANGFATVNAVMAEADASLGLYGLTPSGHSERAHQTALKNALDMANNNLTFVQPGPGSCPVPVFVPAV